MTTPLDIFNHPSFSVRNTTDAINVIPNRYGRLNELNLFPARGIRTTYVQIEYKNGILNLIPVQPRGAPGTKGVRGRRDLRTFSAFHIPHEDEVLADDVQNVRSFGSDNQLMGVQDLVNDKLEDCANKHFITLEHLRIGALKGDILDADGSSLLNLFDEFGIEEHVENFDFSAKGDVAQHCRNISRHIEENLNGEIMNGVWALTSPEFMDKLLTNNEVKEAYKYYSSTVEPLREDARRRFPHQGIMFEEYLGNATHLQDDGKTVSRKFIPAGEARFFPVGTRQSFATYFAPAAFIEAVNTVGLDKYAKLKVKDYDRGVDIHTQSNPLPLCLRPVLLVRGVSG